MTRETKIGLLVGMGVIVIAAILISDYLAGSQRAGNAELVQLEADRAERAAPTAAAPVGGRIDPLPNPRGRAASPPAAHSVVTPAPGPADSVRRERTIIPLYGTGTVDRRTDPPTGDDPTERTFEPDRMVTGQPPAHDNRRTAAGDIVHFVVQGDNLTKLAERYYGDRDYARAIFEANRDKMRSPDHIRIGVRLIIPNRAGMVAQVTPPSSAAPAPAPAPTGRETYTVESGDTLSEIAEDLLGSTARWRELYQINRDRIDDPDNVAVGTVLRLPAN